jgi:hypothetical protein
MLLDMGSGSDLLVRVRRFRLWACTLLYLLSDSFL